MTIAPLFQSSATTAPIWLGTAVQNSMQSSFVQPARFSGMIAGLMQSSSVTQGDEWSQQKIEGLQSIRNSLLNTTPAGNHANAQSLQELAQVSGISKSIAGPVEKPIRHPESAVKLNELAGKVSDYLTGQLLNPSPDPVPQEIQDAAKLINAATIQADSDPSLEPFKQKWASDLESLQTLANALPIAETVVEPSETDAAADFVSLVQEAVNALDADTVTGNIAVLPAAPDTEGNEPFITAAPENVTEKETGAVNVSIPPVMQNKQETAQDNPEELDREAAPLFNQGQTGQDKASAALPVEPNSAPARELMNENDPTAIDRSVPKQTALNAPAADSAPLDGKEEAVLLQADAVKTNDRQPVATDRTPNLDVPDLHVQQKQMNADTSDLSSGSRGVDKTAGKELLLELKNLLSTTPDEKGVIKQSSEAMQLLEKAVALIKGSESPALHEKEAAVQEKAVAVLKQVQELAQQLSAVRPMTPAKSIETVLTAVLQSLPKETGMQPEGKNTPPEGKQLALLQTIANVQQRLTTIPYGVPFQANSIEPESVRHTVENELAQPVQLNLLQLQTFGSKGPAAARSHQPDLFGQFQSVMKQARFGKVNGAEKLLIRLQPEHLGSLKIELTRHEGQLSARVTASTAAGKEMLESQIHQLRQALTGQNIQVDKLDVIFAQEESPLLKEQKDDRNQSGDQPEAQDDQQEVTQDFKEIFMNVEV